MPERPIVLVFGPRRDAISGVSTHVNLLISSMLQQEFSLVHFAVGREGRNEGPLARVARLFASPCLLALTIIRDRVSIVHLNTALTGRAYWRDLVHMIVARMCSARVLFQVHGGASPQVFCRGSRLLAAWLRATLRLPDAIVVLALAEVAHYRAFLPEQRVLLLPNSIDGAAYAGLVRETRDPDAPLQLLYMGRLAREKGLYETLHGLCLARQRGTKARLVIAGSGPEEQELRRMTRELELTDVVSFVGSVTGKGKLDLFCRSDATLLASYGEGLPYALLESMAAGVPVIATRVGAIPDVVEDGVQGLLIAPYDANAVALAIARLAVDQRALLEMGEACRRRIAGRYAIDRLAREFRDLYSHLCPTRA